MIIWHCTCDIVDVDSGDVYECGADLGFHQNHGSELAYREKAKRYFSEQVLCGIAHHIGIWDRTIRLTNFKMEAEVRRPTWEEAGRPSGMRPQLRVLKGGQEVKRMLDPAHTVKYVHVD